MDKWRAAGETSGNVKCGNYLVIRTLCFVQFMKLRSYGTEVLLMTTGRVIDLSPNIEFPWYKLIPDIGVLVYNFLMDRRCFGRYQL
jgi:hypothetical protein